MDLVTAPKDVKKLEDLNVQIKKEIEYQNPIVDKTKLSDTEMISVINSLKRCAHFFYQKGDIVQPYVDLAYGQSREPTSMNVKIMSQYDESLIVREEGALLVSVVIEEKIAVTKKDIEGWWIFDISMMGLPVIFKPGGPESPLGYDDSSFNIVDID